MTIDVAIMINGRKALPLRAIPYVTAWRESPDNLANALAQSHMIRVGGKIQAMVGRKVEIQNRHALIAYQIDAQGDYTPIDPSQWGSVILDLACRTKKLMADERDGADGENYARWRVEATLTLPDNAFIWLDEFQHWYSITRQLKMPSEDDLALWRMEQARQHDGDDLKMIIDEGMADFEREDDSLCMAPILPTEIDGKLWRFTQNAKFIHEPDKITAVTKGTTQVKKNILGDSASVPRGRPSTVPGKAKLVRELIVLFESASGKQFDVTDLPGNVANLLEACKRIEKSITQKARIFSVTEPTFVFWLHAAGYGFAAGRSPVVEKAYWTQLGPQITGKITPEFFTSIKVKSTL